MVNINRFQHLNCGVIVQLSDEDFQIKRLRLSLISSCNFKCLFCHAEGLDAEVSRKITVEDVRVIAAAAQKIGVHRFTITGGEPFLNKNIYEMVEAIAEENNPHDISITTNGSLVSNFDAARLAAVVRKIRINFQGVSGQVYSRMTGFPKQKPTIQFIEKAISSGVEVCLNYVYTTYNKSDALDVIKFGKDIGAEVKVLELVRDNGNMHLYQSLQQLNNELMNKGYFREVINGTENRFSLGNSKVRFISSYCNYDNIKACIEHGEVRVTPDLSLKSCLQSDAPNLSIYDQVKSKDVEGVAATMLSCTPVRTVFDGQKSFPACPLRVAMTCNYG